jgi:hypothetical protein
MQGLIALATHHICEHTAVGKLHKQGYPHI